MENNITLKSINLEKKYGKKTVVKNVSLELNKGEVVGLLGPNGAGKTTSFYMITGMISPTKGSVYLGDKNITNFPMYKRARLGIGYLSQEPSIFTKLSVEENIKLVLLDTENNSNNEIGEPFIHGDSFIEKDKAAIDSDFGSGFSENIINLEKNTWQGPFKSIYGDHLIYLFDVFPEEIISFEDAKQSVVVNYNDEI